MSELHMFFTSPALNATSFSLELQAMSPNPRPPTDAFKKSSGLSSVHRAVAIPLQVLRPTVLLVCFPLLLLPHRKRLEIELPCQGDVLARVPVVVLVDAERSFLESPAHEVQQHI
eukprot:754902-Hanusia_phi.AAC.2